MILDVYIGGPVRADERYPDRLGALVPDGWSRFWALASDIKHGRLRGRCIEPGAYVATVTLEEIKDFLARCPPRFKGGADPATYDAFVERLDPSGDYTIVGLEL
ncbi:MAG: hypothetical protein WCJ30_01795 [Deltaproteobacteria bacterium]